MNQRHEIAECPDMEAGWETGRKGSKERREMQAAGLWKRNQE